VDPDPDPRIHDPDSDPAYSITEGPAIILIFITEGSRNHYYFYYRRAPQSFFFSYGTKGLRNHSYAYYRPLVFVILPPLGQVPEITGRRDFNAVFKYFFPSVPDP
jgi:hypothetical protein